MSKPAIIQIKCVNRDSDWFDHVIAWSSPYSESIPEGWETICTTEQEARQRELNLLLERTREK